MMINHERIKYSPFGKRIMNGFKAEILLSVATVPLAIFLCLIFFSVGEFWLTLITMLILLGPPAYFFIIAVRSTLFEAKLLSAMSDEEHNRLVAEYKKYEERNITRYGHLTSYGMVLIDRILPWENIKEIRFRPGEYRRTGRNGYSYFPAKISVVAYFDKKKVVTSCNLANEEYDLSDEIERFLDSISNYTDLKFAVDNGYYFAK